MAGVAGIAKDVQVQQQLASSAIPLLLKVHAINFYQNVIASIIQPLLAVIMALLD